MMDMNLLIVWATRVVNTGMGAELIHLNQPGATVSPTL